MRYLLPLCVTCRPAGIRTLQLRIHSLVDLLIHNAERINAIPMGGPHVGDDLTLVGACGVRWSLVTLPTFWSLVTLPTSLGRPVDVFFVALLAQKHLAPNPFFGGRL